MRTFFIVFLPLFLSYIHLFSQSCEINATYSDPIKITNQNNVVIEGKRITNPNRHCIEILNCSNVTIRNCILGPSSNEGIYIEGCQNVTIENCSFFDNSSGVHAKGSQGVKVNNNKFYNPQNYGARGQFVSFNEVIGSNNQIINNIGETILGLSRPEDLINIYKSNGTSSSPILIAGNKFRGGGPSGSGGGILVSDCGGSYITIENNILVDPGQHGIGVAGGNNIKVLNNQIYGKQQPFTNVGIYVYNYKNDTLPCSYNDDCYNITLEGNKVNYTNSFGTSNSHFLGDPPNAPSICTPIILNNNNWNATINATILPEDLVCPDLMAHYKFDNTFQDASGSNLHGTGHNGATFISDGKVKSGNFDGNNDYVSVPSSDFLKPSAISVAAWIKPDNLNGINSIIRAPDASGWTEGWRMVLDNANLTIRVVTENATKDLICSGINANQWNYVVFTYDGKKLKGYVNGVLKSSASLTDSIKYTSIKQHMLIGYANGSSSYYFDGKIDEVKIYKGTLSANAILENYNKDKEYLQKGLTAYYKFDNTFQDASGNNLHGGGQNGVSFANDGKNKSGNFDGSNDYVYVLSSSLLKPSSISVAAWIKPDILNGTIIRSPDAGNYNEGWRMNVANQDLFVRMVTNVTTKNINCPGIVASKWNYVVFTYDGSTLKGYVNGNLKTSTSLSGNIKYASTTKNMEIGYANGEATYLFDGRIDEVKIYDNLLSANDISELYNNDKEYLQEGLIAHYEFDSNFQDASGNNLHGKGHSGTTFADDGKNESGNFDGLNDYVSISSSSLLKPSVISVAAWVKPDNLNGFNAIIRAPDASGWTEGWRMVLNQNALEVRVVTSTEAKSIYCSGINVNHWSYVVFTYDGSNLRGYVNGVLKSTTALSGSIKYTTSQSMLIGYANGDATYYFDGKIDEVKIYRNVIATSKILDLYHENKGFFGISGGRYNDAISKDKSIEVNSEEKSNDHNNSQLYPVPTSSKLKYNFFSEGQFSTLLIYNALGATVLMLELDNSEYQEGEIDVSRYPKGIYFIKAVSQNGMLFSKKIIID